MNFADTGAFLSLFHGNDQHHRDAMALWPLVEKPVFTSNLVIAELAKLLAYRMGYPMAIDRVSGIYASTGFRILPSTRTDELSALEWMRKFSDQDVSFTDCVSFAMMRRLKIRTALTFDRHFQLAGFEIIGLR